MKNYNQISNEDGEILVKTARRVVTEYLNSRTKAKLDEKFEASFSFNSGVFVTTGIFREVCGVLIGASSANRSRVRG